MKEAAIQRRHNLYRDSIILANSDPNLHLLEENSIDWASHYGGGKGGGGEREENRIQRRRQVVSMILSEGMAPTPYGSCLEVPGVEEIPEENEMQSAEDLEEEEVIENNLHKQPTISEVIENNLRKEPTISVVSKSLKDPGSPDSVHQIRQLIRPVLEVVLPSAETDQVLTNGMLALEEGEEIQAITTEEDMTQKDSAIASAIQELENAVQDEEGNVDFEVELPQASADSSPRHHDDSGFQSPTNENTEEEEPRSVAVVLKDEARPVGPELVMVMLEDENEEVCENGSGEAEGEINEDFESHI